MNIAKIQYRVALALLAYSCSSSAVTINVFNASSRVINAELYEALEKEASRTDVEDAEPEYEVGVRNIKPGFSGVLKKNLNVNKYELDVYNTKDSANWRKLDILVDNNNNVINVIVSDTDIRYRKKAEANPQVQREPSYRRTERRCSHHDYRYGHANRKACPGY
jgi:hypothetical protein